MGGAPSSGAGGATCGDGFVTPPEQCDDGDTTDFDECSADCRCGDGAMGTIAFMHPTSGHCYAAYSGDISWSVAAALCANDGGYLAAVTSLEERDFLSSATASFGVLWMGANDLAIEGEWVWQNGEPWLMKPCTTEPTCDATLDLWDFGEPNDYMMIEDCGTLVSQFNWLNDQGCPDSYPRLCERSP
jgi:cysteine-rich repeat protein